MTTHQSTSQRISVQTMLNHDSSSFCTYRNNDGLLAGFLLRHPFSSRSLLESVFGEGVLRVLLEKEAGQFREVDIPDLGPCYAPKDEPNASLLGVHRREVARWFALTRMGSDAVRSGLSPGLGGGRRVLLAGRSRNPVVANLGGYRRLRA